MGLVPKLSSGDDSQLEFGKDKPAPDVSPPKDKAPKKALPKASASATARKPASAAELKKIEDALTDFICMPAMAFEFKGDEWPAEHVNQRGPILAKRITKLAEQKPEFREQLLKMIDGGVWGPLIFAGIMYSLPIAVYYELVPLPVPARMALVGGTPIRSEMEPDEDADSPSVQGAESSD